MEKTTSNILYLTSACQLACKYCYEAEKRKQLKEDFWITEEQIREVLDFFKEHENRSHNLLFFGGEPLLAYDKIEYAVKYVIDTLKFDNFSFGLITNGIRFADEEFFNTFFALLAKYPKVSIKVEISYDGSGQKERVFPNGEESEPLVLKAINLFEENKKDFYLRYTLNTTTYSIILEEIIYLFEKYKYLQGITVNVAASNLDAIEGDYNKSVDKLRPYFNAVYELYKKPICGFTCDLCKKCRPNEFNMHYVPGIGNKISSKIQGSFDRWNPLVGEEYISERYDLEGRAIGTKCEIKES